MGVLDDMTKGITERKAKAAGPRLTPVGTEASSTKPSLGVPEVPEVFLTNEAIRDIAIDLRRQAGVLIEVADGLDRQTSLPTASEAPAVDAKAAEKEADAKAAARKAQPKSTEEFADHLATITAEAQAAVFTSADAPAAEPEAPVTPASGWTCPDHGDESLKQLTSRAKRLYMACQVAGCKHFEKG